MIYLWWLEGKAYDKLGMNKLKQEYLVPALSSLRTLNIFKEAFLEVSIEDFSAYDSNPFVNMAIMRDDKLTEFNRILNIIKESGIQNPKWQYVVSRISSNEFDQCMSLIDELSFYSNLLENEYVTDIQYENIMDSDHDFRIIIDSCEINFELTGLRDSIAAKNIKLGFSKLANELLSIYPSNTYVKIDVLTNKLLNQNGEMDSDFIFNNLYEKIVKIAPIVTVVNGFWPIERFGGDGSKSILDYEIIFPFFYEQGKRFIELSKSKDGREILDSIPSNYFDDFPIYSFISGDFPYQTIEVINNIQIPSDSEYFRGKAILNQLYRRISEKIIRNQLKDQVNPILAVKFEDIIYRGYADSVAYFADPERITHILKIIKRIFDENQELKILGFILFEENIKNSIFIINPHNEIDQKQLQLIEKMGVEIIQAANHY